MWRYAFVVFLPKLILIAKERKIKFTQDENGGFYCNYENCKAGPYFTHAGFSNHRRTHVCNKSIEKN